MAAFKQFLLLQKKKKKTVRQSVSLSDCQSAALFQIEPDKHVKVGLVTETRSSLTKLRVFLSTKALPQAF